MAKIDTCRNRPGLPSRSFAGDSVALSLERCYVSFAKGSTLVRLGPWLVWRGRTQRMCCVCTLSRFSKDVSDAD